MDLRIPENRILVLRDIKTPENKDRKDKSFETTEIYNGRLRQYVVEYLETQHSSSTVKEMPIQMVNIAKRIVSEKASIYNDAPMRHYQNMSDEQVAVVNNIYNDMKADYMLSKANEFYALQNQCLLQCVPLDGKFKLRVLKLHHFDIVPMPNNPEEPLAVLISSYDKSNKVSSRESNTPVGKGSYSRPNKSDMSDQVDQSISDPDDKGPSTFEVWTREYIDENGELIPALNFVMDKKGNILSDDPLSPVPFLPFIDVSGYKDFTFFCSTDNSLTDFSKSFSALYSEICQGHRMQSFSQPILSGPKDLLPSNLEVGPNTILMLPSDPDLGEVKFEFASPGGSVAHGIELAEQVLAQFLSCQGVDPKIISSESGNRYSSGIERLLATLEKFEASKVDISLFHEVENKLFHIVHHWHNALQGTDVLLDKYKMPQLSDDADVTVTFARPEGAQTMLDKVSMHERLIGQGLGSRVTAIMDLYDMDRSEAEEYVAKIDLDEQGDFTVIPDAMGNPEEV